MSAVYTTTATFSDEETAPEPLESDLGQTLSGLFNLLFATDAEGSGRVEVEATVTRGDGETVTIKVVPSA